MRRMRTGASWMGACLAMAVASLFYPLPALSAAAGKKVRLDLYVMSLCPFGVQAENSVFPTVKNLSNYVDLNLFFIAAETRSAGGMPTFAALHGEPEVRENIRQICAMKLYPGKYMEYILERNKTVASPEWKSAAAAAGIDPSRIEECAGGPQGAAWFSKNIEFSRARGASSSPTIDIAGKPYSRGRSQAAITAAVCDAIMTAGRAQPPACERARLAAAFGIKVVVEENCALCKPTLIDSLAALHPRADIRVLGADSREGRELIKHHGARTLPLYILDSKAEQDENFSRLLPVAYYKSRDGYLIKHGPGNFFPSVQLERRRSPRHLDIFLESLSPASAAAGQDLMRFLVEEAKAIEDITFSLHLVERESLSGTDEAENRENARQLCLFQHADIGTYFTYLTCRNRDLRDAGLGERCLSNKTESVRRCLENKEGENFLRQDAALARELGITSAPMFVWENRYGPFSWNEEDWRGLLLGSRETAGKDAPSKGR